MVIKYNAKQNGKGIVRKPEIKIKKHYPIESMTIETHYNTDESITAT